MTLPPDLALSDSAGKDALILALFERLNELTARLEILEADNAALRAENALLRAENAELRKDNAELRAKLNLPPKKPDNSSTPPSRGHKGSEGEQRKPKGKSHAGAHRQLHPNPTRRTMLRLRSASIAKPRSRVSNRQRFTLTNGSRFLRSDLK